MIEADQLRRAVDACWDDEILPALADYIRIPNLSPQFDPDWAANGHMDRAVELLAGWARAKVAPWPEASVEIVRLPGRTPLLMVSVPGEAEGDVLLYGHLDKQPGMDGWADGLGPWSPRLVGERLYGRGGADDGYALFGALAAIAALREQDVPHARCTLLIEASEESGSPDLPAYMDHLADRLGTPSLIVCLDAGCGTYDRLWLTTSLRGILEATLTVRVLEQGVHSGDASGVVPSCVRIVGQLLARLEDPATGRIVPAALEAVIPPHCVAEAKAAAAVLGGDLLGKFPVVAGLRAIDDDPVELVLNRTWRAQLSVTGADGLPPSEGAGSVLPAAMAVKLSLRLPPTVDAERAAASVKSLLEAHPPYGARVDVRLGGRASGWTAPEPRRWLKRSLAAASDLAFGAPPASMGEGGSIPFMAMLGRRFPQAPFVITGVLGPQSNAHGPNEFLHLPTARRVTVALARILADHGEARGQLTLSGWDVARY